MADIFNLFNQQTVLDYDNFTELTFGAGAESELRPGHVERVRGQSAAVPDAAAGARRREAVVLIGQPLARLRCRP